MDSRKVWTWVGIVAAALVVLGVFWYVIFGMQATVPNVVGATSADAVRKLQAAGFTLGQTTAATGTTQPAGTVIAQQPAAGTKAKKGAPVGLTVAKPQDFVTVPDVTGMEASAAADAVSAVGLKAVPYSDYSTSAPAGQTFGQVPLAGQQVAPGTTVALGVSRGAEPPAPSVPNVVGKSKSSATSALKDANFATKVYGSYSSSVASGTVMSQFPAAGAQALPGSTVAIQVSKGKAPAGQPANVSVPNVVGKTEAAASSALKGAGLGVGTYHVFSSTVAKGNVAGQVPAAGAKVAPGTVVGIAISDGAAPSGGVTVPNLVGKSANDATATIAGLGLTAVVVPDPQGEGAAGTVTSQLPAPGSKVPAGSDVAIVVAGSDLKPTPY